MRYSMIFALVMLMLAAGCDTELGHRHDCDEHEMSGTQKLLLDDQDLKKLGLEGTGCLTEDYETDEYSPLAQYSFCNYTILDGTEVIIELKRFTSQHDLNSSYQYESSHLRSAKGLISEDDLGDQSRFYVNHEEDYGAEHNEPGVYFYHLYICKDEYLIHITSRGRTEEAQEHIAEIGKRILGKFSL